MHSHMTSDKIVSCFKIPIVSQKYGASLKAWPLEKNFCEILPAYTYCIAKNNVSTLSEKYIQA